MEADGFASCPVLIVGRLVVFDLSMSGSKGRLLGEETLSRIHGFVDLLVGGSGCCLAVKLLVLGLRVHG